MKLNNVAALSILGVAIQTTPVLSSTILSDTDVKISGYVDFVGTYTETAGSSDSNFDTKLAEIETVFEFTPEGSAFSAVAELTYNGTDVGYETVTVSYAFSDALSVSVGNILSYQGFETYDATGLYQFSYAGLKGDPLYSAGYAFGASVDYVTDDFGAGVWIGNTSDSLSVETLLQYTGVEGLTVKFIYANDPGYETYNVWASYEMGNTTLAAEYVTTDWETAGGEVEDAFMVMVNQSFGKAAVTLRYSNVSYNDGVEGNKYTIAPSYVFSDNLAGLVEASIVDIDGADSTTELAAELIFTF